MHFRTLAVVEIPKMTGNSTENKPAENPAFSSTDPRQFIIDMYNREADLFPCQVIARVNELMEPYYVATEDPRYLEFFDCTEELKEDFAQKVDCIKLPDGKIVEYYSYPWCLKYTIRDGKIYQKMASLLKHEKRTRKAKRIAVLPDYPRAKLYKSLKDYAENYRGMYFDEEYHAYGQRYNPNGIFDWYEIGGRWSRMFLVKDTCKECFLGERIQRNKTDQLDVPEGYLWVSAARKKDIEWQAMRDWIKKKLTEHFYQLEKMFHQGKLEEDVYGRITEEGILGWDGYLYHAGESLNAYLERTQIHERWKYPCAVHDIVDAEQWISTNNDVAVENETEQTNPADWHSSLDQYIDDLGDDAVLVGVDYHI